MSGRPTPTGNESRFDSEEIIVSKTDLNGRITYANDVFLRVSGYTEAEVIGQPHSVLRHPEMPRCVFRLLWKTIQNGEEMFAYVVNLAKNGDHYWVYAHVTPTFGPDGALVGFHSNRRCPEAAALDKIRPLYASLLAAERGETSKADAIAKSEALLSALLAERGVRYDQFVFTL